MAAKLPPATRSGVEKGPRIRVLGLLKEPCGFPSFYDNAILHDGDTVANLRGNAKITEQPDVYANRMGQNSAR